MPKFLDEAWFWAGLYGVLGSALTLLITKGMRRKSQLSLERLRLFDSEILAAHKQLYVFASDAMLQFAPSEDPRRDFVSLMKGDYYKTIKSNLLMFSPRSASRI